MDAPMIYFIQQGTDGPIKIGYTGGDVEDRLRALQTGSPHKLTLLGFFEGTTKQEKEAHERLKTFRLEGEWFKPETAVLDYLANKRWHETVNPQRAIEQSHSGFPEHDYEIEDCRMRCAACNQPEMHFQGIRHLDATDNYTAVVTEYLGAGRTKTYEREEKRRYRGDEIEISFFCEHCPHLTVLTMSFHKGGLFPNTGIIRRTERPEW